MKKPDLDSIKNIKVIRDKKVVFGAVILSVLVIAGLFAWAFINFTNTKGADDHRVSLTGNYTIDGLNWEKFDSETIDYNNYPSMTVKGKFSEVLPTNKYLIIPVTDIWMNFKIDGKSIINNQKNKKFVSTDTPGYSVEFIPTGLIHNDSVIEINLKNPYPEYINTLSYDTLFNNFLVGNQDSFHNDLLKNETLNIFLGITIFFLGLFGFGFCGILFAKNRDMYLSFSFLAAVCGYYIVSDSVNLYSPLWIDNPFLCMLFDEVGTYLIVLSASVYMRTAMENKVTKALMNVAVTFSVVSILVAVTLQLTGVQDILKSEMMLYPGFLLGVVGGFVSLNVEDFKFKNEKARMVLMSIGPIIIGTVLEVINNAVGFAPYRVIMRICITISIIIQFTLLIIATRNHYKEMLRYQTMQKELLEARVSIMVSQIQPHFLYNSLTSIAMLCTKDPQMAKTATINFADYLRGNMNSLKEKAPIPFEKELEHLEKYLMLEKMRFRELLEIEYDIETTDFYIPSLTVQPLVENAVKHGVGMKDDGGTVTISTRETEDSYLVIVSDDGVGFDVNEKKNDGRQHVGMENCKHRLKNMCNATVEITSEIGKGTVSKIIIPKEKD